MSVSFRGWSSGNKEGSLLKYKFNALSPMEAIGVD